LQLAPKIPTFFLARITLFTREIEHNELQIDEEREQLPEFYRGEKKLIKVSEPRSVLGLG
jgi:hypothetical protein